ncbi:MAG: type VI secretion system baseplate subunit TssF [Pirellulaceae bacterium]
MTDELLPYYNRELAYFRRVAARFARVNPKIAGRLRIGPDSSEDPHVERLIEAFAFLNARIRCKLEDDFPELSDALLSVLYPHFVAPIPSMAIVKFALDRRQSKLKNGYDIPRGSMLQTEPLDGEPCRFRTCYDVKAWPIEVVSARLEAAPFESPGSPHSSEAVAAIAIKLRCLSAEMKFGDLAASTLRFYLAGLPQHTQLLYELLFNSTLDIALANSARDARPLVLPKHNLRYVGFNRDEGMLPYSSRSALGYRLLTEFFAFPQKFLFFDLVLPERERMAELGSEVELFVHLEQTSVDLERNVSRTTFQLGCTPMVNLFRQRAEPIQLTQTESEYRVVPDSRRPLATEVYSIDEVTGASPSGDEYPYVPFYSIEHASRKDERQKFWYADRRDAEPREGIIDHGSEVYLNLVDLDFTPSPQSGWFVDIGTTCFNRDLPNRLPFGGGQPKLSLSEGGGGVASIECLTAPTPTRRPPRKHRSMWKLISHLSLGHLSLVDGEHGAAALREMLQLYDFADSPDTRAMIAALVAVDSRRVTGRVASRHGAAICRGVEVEVQLDPDGFSDHSLCLFACVLENFLSQYCSINSFAKLVVKTKRHGSPWRTWAPRSGERPLL